MITRVIVATGVSALIASIAFAQMKYSRSRSGLPTPTPTPSQKTAAVQTQPSVLPPRTTPPPIQPRSTSTPRTTLAVMQPASSPAATPVQAKPTPTPVPPPDIKAYLDRQLGNSKDKKFHMTVNGKDLALTPFHVWPQKSTGTNSTSSTISMKSDEGQVYDIDFVTSGGQVTGIKIHRINGEDVR